MNIEDEKRLDALLDLFVQPGWKILIESLSEAHTTLVETAWLVNDEKALYRRKGHIDKLNEMLAFESLVRMQKDDTQGP